MATKASLLPAKIIKRATGPGIAALALIICLSAGAYSRADATPASGRKLLVPVGQVAGIRLMSDGVLVIRFNGEDSAAAEAGLMAGDLILELNGQPVSSAAELQKLLQESRGAPMKLLFEREGKTAYTLLRPRRDNDGRFLIGAWVRDGLSGLGTVTYYDPSEGAYGALGHAINDADTGKLMPALSGSLTAAKVTGVKKGARGVPGELEGDALEQVLGSVELNSAAGVFGKADDPSAFGGREPLEAAYYGEITDGAAFIISDVSGVPREYAVDVVRIPDGGLKDLSVRIVDGELLAITGGIVQGMSGSPIIQNGRLIGALTHVLVDDPAAGYGISIEKMLDAANETGRSAA